MARRWKHTLLRKRAAPDFEDCRIEDVWDLIHYRCPLSPLEARVLVYRYILGIGERQLATELNVPWRKLNNAAWRMKAKLRAHLVEIQAMR